MTGVEFLQRYPEFTSTDPAQLESVLVETERALSADVYGDRFDDAHGALSAHVLWTNPSGVSLRLDGDPEPPKKSRFWEEFARIRKEVAPRQIVT